MNQLEQGIDYHHCLFNCKLKRKKMFGKQSRYFYVFEDKLVVNQDALKQKSKRVISFKQISRVVWNYAKKAKSEVVYLKSFTIVQGKEELKYYGEQDILIALKRIIAKFVFQSKVQDEYEAQTVLGEGSYATVLTLRHLHSNFKFAGKCIEKKKLEKIENGMNSVLNEIAIMRALSPHSQIVNLHEVYDGDQNIYLVMDLCEGGSLLSEMKDRSHLFDKNEIKQILHQLLSAVEYIHSKDIMHRDLKPENILFQKAKDYSTLKLADFGLSAFSKQVPYLYPKCGTPGYVAPEGKNSFYTRKVANLVDKTQGYNIVCDVFSVGVIFHLLLMGEGVFPGKGHLELLKKNKECDIRPEQEKYDVLDNVTKDLLFSMLKVNPKSRPSASTCLQHSYFTNSILEKTLVFSQLKIQIEEDSSLVTQELIMPIHSLKQGRLSTVSVQKQSQSEEDDKDQ